MRSHGLIYRPDGTLKHAWSWQDRTRDCPFHIPIEDGDEVVLLDAEHPDVPDELAREEIRDRQRVMRAEWAQARSVVIVRVPGGENEYMLNGGIDRGEPVVKVLSRSTERKDESFVDEPLAHIERKHP